ncbi:MAG TPA: Fic family protein [Saprospiraceae bacterium]|nr:Fic family protein [Saprospiraceae bacterium]
MEITSLGSEICQFLKDHPNSSSKEIHNALVKKVSYATVKRELQDLIAGHLIVTSGQGRGTKYSLHEGYMITVPIDPQVYFKEDIDQRHIKNAYDFRLIEILTRLESIFTNEEKTRLTAMQDLFERHVANMSPALYAKEFERLAIDLSWKSSQIEGNTYTLLETERLIRDKITAHGKTKDEATMVLNHKAAIDFIVEHPESFDRLSIRTIEEIHSLLISELNIPRNIRNKRVGITGTNYRPLENEYQITEALHDMCKLINHRKFAPEKALLALILLSYIQPFEDGNKRTARIICNALLMHDHYCPLSFRTVDPATFKDATLIFYEQNNLSVVKKIFIEQFEFAVQTYF